jgi:hypothetical protein
MATKSTKNGNAEAPVQISTLPPVVGINFGNSYASIAVFTKVCFEGFFFLRDLWFKFIDRKGLRNALQTRMESDK